MRTGLAAALALVLAVPALAAETPPDAEPAIEAVKAMLKTSRSASFRKIKISPAGDVCALVSPSAGSDEREVLWTKASGVVWINEAPDEVDSEFVWGHPNLRRSTNRPDYQAWKACQKG